MKVELLIADDKELRASIKELIKSEILNVARSEIKDILASATKERVPTVTVENLMKEEIKATVKRAIDNGGYSQPSFIQIEARKEISAIIQEQFGKGKAV